MDYGKYTKRFQPFVDAVKMPCCVMSCEKKEDGTCGDIHILCSNEVYKKMMGPAYYDGMIYYELVPKDNKFEDFVYHAAINGRRMHAYVETTALDAWTDQTLVPLTSDEEGVGFCQFLFEFTKGPEADRMANVSIGLSELIIKSCINLMGADDFHSSLNEVVTDMKNAAEAKAARVLVLDRENKEVHVLSDIIDDDAWPDRDKTDPDVIDYDLVTGWEKVLGVSNNIIVKDDYDMRLLGEIDPEWAESMTMAGVKNLVLTPLRRNRQIIGYLYLVNYNTEKTTEVKELIELMAFFMGSEISNYMLVNKLDEMSHSDALTGLNNRHAMMQRIRRMNEAENPKQFGIVNLDLNGLKYVNDNHGHDKGDELLIEAATTILKVFRRDEVYRVGGDEFVIIAEGITEEILNNRLRQFRAVMSESPGISFAVGSCWSDGSDNPSDVIKRADDLMYEDKKEYYRKHPTYLRK